MSEDSMPEFADEVSHRHGHKALWFTAVPLLAVLALLGFAAWKQHFFSATDQLYAFADSSAGIAVGMPVRIQGFAVGAVKDMTLVPPEGGKPPQVRISLDVKREYMGYIGKESVLRLSREGFIGQPVLDLIQGDQRARRAADGDVLAFERPRTVSEIAEDLNAKAALLLGDLKELAQKLKDPDGDLMHTLGTTRQIVHDVDDTTRAVGALAKRSEDVVAKSGVQAERALATASRVLERTEQVMPKVEGVIDNVLDASRSASGAAHKAEGVLDGGERLVGDAGQLVKGAKRSWPFNMWAPPEKSETLDVDSQDNGKSFVTPRPVETKP